MFFSKSIPISKSSFDHKKSMAKNKTQGEMKSNYQEETSNAEQRRTGAAIQTKPQRQRAGRSEGELTRGTA
jgi:hypothetical protein